MLASLRSWDVAELSAPFDTLSLLLQGPGRTGRLAFVGSREQVLAARRFPQNLGGGMRQPAIWRRRAARAGPSPGSLGGDHASARVFATPYRRRGVDVAPVETNIVIVTSTGAEAFRAREARGEPGVLMNPPANARFGRSLTRRQRRPGEGGSRYGCARSSGADAGRSRRRAAARRSPLVLAGLFGVGGWAMSASPSGALGARSL